MKGFLGTRGDLLSDVLIVAVIIIVPALITAVVLVKKKRFALHRAIMMSIFSVLVLYVVIYEANLTFLGGLDYLRANIRISEGPYFTLVTFHISPQRGCPHTWQYHYEERRSSSVFWPDIWTGLYLFAS